MLTRAAHEKQIALRLIEPGKPNQNAYIEFVQSASTRRMSERALAHPPCTCKGGDRNLET